MNDIMVGDALAMLKKIPSKSINTCITSPPYFGLRDYGVDGQIGLEETPNEYVQKLVEVFREVRRVLCDDGTLWLNLGDSYAGSWGNYGGQNRGNGKQREIVNGSQVEQKAYEGKEHWKPPTANNLGNGIKPKDLIGIPWMVAFALRADGWYLRQDIIWHKPNPMPESVRDRCTKSHEYIFLLSKSQKYYYDNDAIKEPSIYQPEDRESVEKGSFQGKHHAHQEFKHISESFRAIRETRNKRSVWTVPTKAYREAHFAVFPEELIIPCILAGSPEGGVVLDPFAGSGTTLYAAKKLARNYFGIELNPAYAEIANNRLKGIEESLFLRA